MGISRRAALQAMAAGVGTAVSALTAGTACAASAADTGEGDGLLYDATRCIGCKACMVACNEAGGIPPDTRLSQGRWQAPVDLNQYTRNIIKLYDDPDTGERSYVKRQCMHCIDPACATACMLGALKKREHGIVTYKQELCVGCRYCEMACPFGIPKFEWESLAGKIVKCELCHERIADGGVPACTAVCPTGAVIYGRRDRLLADARDRLRHDPKRYVPRIYGEHEAGGTQVLYLSGVAFEKLGLPEVGNQSLSARVRNMQHTLYQGMVLPAALYALLAAVMLRNRKRHLEEGHLTGAGEKGAGKEDRP